LFVEENAHGTNKNIDENDTKRRIQQALCKNKKKRCMNIVRVNIGILTGWNKIKQ
jgi:hypothetical protein